MQDQYLVVRTGPDGIYCAVHTRTELEQLLASPDDDFGRTVWEGMFNGQIDLEAGGVAFIMKGKFIAPKPVQQVTKFEVE